MKKCLLVLLVLACMIACMSVFAGAEVAEEAPPVETAAGDTGGSMSVFQRMINTALYSIIPTFSSLVSRLGGAAILPYVVLAVALLFFALFGYRFYLVIRIALGALAGFFVGYVGWHVIVLSASSVPAFLLEHELVFYILTLTISPVIGAVLAVLMRRVGIAIGVTIIASVLVSPAIINPVIYYVLMALFLVVSLAATKQCTILLTSLACPIFALYLLLGPNGFRPIAFGAYLASVVEPILLIGIFAGVLCFFAQRRICRIYR